MRSLFMLLMLLMSSVASAGMFKCISAKGSVTYSDSPCLEKNKSIAKLPIENSPQPPKISGKPSWEIDHDRVVMKHILMGDLDGAERLAVTPNQKNMVAEALYLKRSGNISKKPKINPRLQDDTNSSSDSAARDFDVQVKAKRDYQKQQIPGAITHQPTDIHEREVYKQEMKRQKNIDPNTWYR